MKIPTRDTVAAESVFNNSNAIVPTRNTRRFRTGDRVTVRTAAEILSTLDADGTLDGLPFMPEMVEWCGQPFRVQRQVEKTCVDGHPMRQFPRDDVVILDGPRCSGQSHDGCGHGCRVFWKEAWLRHTDDGAPPPPDDDAANGTLLVRLKVKADEHHYFCQSTQLYAATREFPTTQRHWTLRIMAREIRSGDVSVFRMWTLLARRYWMKFLRARGAEGLLRGPNKRTPNESLSLQPGERVRVKTRAQIAATLDNARRNRGMAICTEMIRCSGREAEVRYRIDRLIDEKTGVMRELTNTVTLCNIQNDATLADECLCYKELGDCPRGEIMYWREIWLERIKPGDA